MLRFNHTFNVSADTVWGVIGQVDRVDWVPGVKQCVLEGDPLIAADASAFAAENNIAERCN